MKNSLMSFGPSSGADEVAVTATVSGLRCGGRKVNLNCMNNVMPGLIGQSSKSKSKFKKRYICLLGFLVVMAAFVTYLMGYTHREMALAGICLAALAGMCFIAALAMMVAFMAFFKRMKETRRRALPRSAYNADLLNLPASFVGE
jgi:hypothetical protein